MANVGVKWDALSPVLGALTPAVVQLLTVDINAIVSVDTPTMIVFALRGVALIWAGVVYDHYLCQDADPKKRFLNGMAAPSILIAAVEPLLR